MRTAESTDWGATDLGIDGNLSGSPGPCRNGSRSEAGKKGWGRVTLTFLMKDTQEETNVLGEVETDLEGDAGVHMGEDDEDRSSEEEDDDKGDSVCMEGREYIGLDGGGDKETAGVDGLG